MYLNMLTKKMEILKLKEAKASRDEDKLNPQPLEEKKAETVEPVAKPISALDRLKAANLERQARKAAEI